MEPEKYVHRIKVEWLQSAPQVLHIRQPCTKSLLIEQKLGHQRNTLLQSEKKKEFTKQRNLGYGNMCTKSKLNGCKGAPQVAFFSLAQNHC